MTKYLLLTLWCSEVAMLRTEPYQGNAVCIRSADAAYSRCMAALTLEIAFHE
jgi:hypothetical protein